MSILRQEDETDFVLEEDATSCWIAVGNISVYIRRDHKTVAVDLYPLGQEMYDSLGGTWASFSESEEAIEDELGNRDDRRGETEDRSKLVRQAKDGHARRPKGGGL